MAVERGDKIGNVFRRGSGGCGQRREREADPCRLVNRRNGPEKRGRFSPKSGRRSSMLMMRGSRCTDGSIIARRSTPPLARSCPPLYAILWEDICHLREAYSICFIEITGGGRRATRRGDRKETRFPPFRTSIFDHPLFRRLSREYSPTRANIHLLSSSMEF